MQYRGWKIYAHYYRHSFHIFYFNFCVVYASNNRRCQLHVYVWKDIIALLAAPVLHVKYICGVIFPGNVVMVQTIKMLMDIFAHCNFFFSPHFSNCTTGFYWFMLHSFVCSCDVILSRPKPKPMLLLLLILLYWIA